MFNSVEDVKKLLRTLKKKIQSEQAKKDKEILNTLIALEKVFDITQAVADHENTLKQDEITDIGQHGLTLIDVLVEWLSDRQWESERRDIEQASLVIAQWVIANNGKLMELQSVTEGLATLANSIEDKQSLLQLARFMGNVVHACHDDMKHDLDTSDQNRPWRVLNINRGIVATRTHDLDTMYSVFPELIEALPMDAPDFFKEGMSEMVRLHYPDFVCEVMQEFRDRTMLPPVH